MQNAILHMGEGVPLSDLPMTDAQRSRMVRVEHVFWQWLKNPYLEPYELLKQMLKGRGCDAPSEFRMLQRDKLLFDFMAEQFSPPSRRISEARVRAAGNHLMKMGMETDNGKDIEAGAKIIIKLDKLDQPESQQVDMSKALFLPPVVTTSAHEVDDTKADLSDKQALDIMRKYDAHIDEKRKMVEEKVEIMMAARSGADSE